MPILLVGLLQPLAFIILLLLALSGFFAFRASKKIVEPINQLDLEHPEEGESYEEIAPLLTKIHKQQKTIAVQLAEAKRQPGRFCQITADMEEGLLVIDEHGALLSVNPSALRLLEVKDVQPSENVLTLNRSEPFRRAVETALDGRHEAARADLRGNVLSSDRQPGLARRQTLGCGAAARGYHRKAAAGNSAAGVHGQRLP